MTKRPLTSASATNGSRKMKGPFENSMTFIEERWMVSRSDTRMDNSRAKRRYPALFQNYDLAVGRESAAEIVEKIHRSVISEDLSAGMTEWFFVVPKYSGLLAVVDLLDPDPGRAALRAAIVNDDNDRVKEIGRTIDGSRLAPAYAIGLGLTPPSEMMACQS